jgi:hypothetical protein
MKTYLLVLGWWNLIGCGLMLGFFNETFGRKMLNEWTRIFATPYTLDYWSKFWLSWAIGLNVFFALVNILAAKWEFLPLMRFTVGIDIMAYLLFIGLTVWGVTAKRTGSGIYSVFVIFAIWLSWGTWALITSYN